MVHPALDDLDLAILRELQADGRLSNADLARRIGLSPPATHARRSPPGARRRHRPLRRAPGPRGGRLDLLCFVSVGLRPTIARRSIASAMRSRRCPRSSRCHHVTGEYDYLLRVALRNRRDLERFVVDRLAPLPGIAPDPDQPGAARGEAHHRVAALAQLSGTPDRAVPATTHGGPERDDARAAPHHGPAARPALAGQSRGRSRWSSRCTVTTREQRLAALSEAGYNTFLLRQRRRLHRPPDRLRHVRHERPPVGRHDAGRRGVRRKPQLLPPRGGGPALLRLPVHRADAPGPRAPST